MKVRDIMTSPAHYVAPQASVVEVAQIMKNLDVGSVPVCEPGEKLVGLITDRDIVLRAIAAGKNPSDVKAQEVMSTNLITISPDDDTHKAAQLMAQYQIRRLPVVDNGKLIGMLAIGDLAVEQIHVDEAGEALSDISQGIRH